MSTKTSIKRIALVAVSALGFGLLSVVPAKAADGASAPTLSVAGPVYLDLAESTTVALNVEVDTAAADDTFTVALTAPTGSGVTLADNNGSAAGTTAVFDATGFADTDTTGVTAVAVSSTTGVATITDPGTATAGTIDAGDFTFSPDIVGTYKLTVTTANGDSDSVTFYAADLYAVTGDGLTSGNQSKLTVNGVAGAVNTVTLGFRSQTDARLITVTGSTVVSVSDTSAMTISADKTMITVLDGAAADLTFTVATPAAGTITVSAFDESQAGIFKTTSYGTVTITVNSTGLSGVYSAADSSVQLSDDVAAAYAIDFTTADSTINSSALVPGTLSALIGVRVRDGLAAALAGETVTVTSSSAAAVVSAATTVAGATYANGGIVDSVLTSAVDTGTLAAGTAVAGVVYVGVYTTGTAGTANIEVKVGSSVLATKSVTFYGEVNSLTLTKGVNSIPDSADGLTQTDTDAIVGYLTATDANGVPVPVVAANFTVSSAAEKTAQEITDAAAVDLTAARTLSTGLVLPATTKAAIVVDPAANKRGTKTITLTHTDSGVSTTVTFVVAEDLATGTQVTTMSTNKGTYTPGELVTLTVRSVDAFGNIMQDGNNAYFTSAVTANAAVSGTLPGANVTLVNGVATYTLYAPVTTGTVTLSAPSIATGNPLVTVSFLVSDGTTEFSNGDLTASVESIPFAGEASGTVASFDYSATATAGDSTTVRVNLTNKPSGSTLSNSDIVLSDATADAETTFAANVMTIVAGDASPEASVNISFGGVALIAGTYTLTITPAASAGGAAAQTVSFTVTARATDEARLTSITTAAAGANLGTVKDPVVVVAGGTVASPAPAGVSTIRLRADLISFPAGGYVNTFASAPSSVALGRFPGGVPTVDTNSNMVTYLGTFVGCSPTNAAHKAATYTASTNTISAAAGCDIVAARAGNATLAATGAGIFTFTPTVAGDYVLRVWQDANNDGILNVNEVRSERTITVGAYSSWSSQYSTSFINAVSPSAATGVASKKATTQTALGDFTGDETILAPKGTVTAATFVKVARVKVTLKDADDVALDSRSTFPTITATITGPGTLAIDATGAAVTPVGRAVSYTPTSLLTNDGGPEVLYVNIFNDGNAGASSIEIKIGSTVFATETLKFYGAVTAVAATNGLKVLPATAGTYGCVTSTTACGSLTVATTPAVKLVATDANGTPVPYRTYSAVSSADTVFAGIPATAPAAGALVSETDGAAWFPVSVLAGGTTVKSGATGTLTYSTNTGTATAPVLVSGSALTFSLGGAAASATLEITGNKNVGDKASMTFTVKDAAGNAAFDKDHSIALKSNIALTTAVGQLAAAANAIAVRNGTSSIDFFNPLVAGTVNIDALIDGLLAVSASSSVINAAQDASNEAIAAAQDAAAEAIDAANAATDAANLAAEAADAATVAAEEARDAADAATAAVEELATQVATLMAALKAQITTLANTVAKIAKKVRA